MIINKTIILFNLRAFFLLMLGFILALYASWMTSAALGYGYSFWYEFYDSEQHIARFAPQNKYRQGFETTSVIEHKKLFQEIVESVHADGKGLQSIHYYYNGKAVSLLHEAEIIHLQDVANLINNIHRLILYVALMFCILYVSYILNVRRFGNLISRRGQLCISAVITLIVLLLFLVLGAKDIFYQMHILIFPADHQWFFYYQDSLMSTMMKAPDLFAGIAFQILIIGAFFFAVGLLLHHVVMSRCAIRSSKGGRAAKR